MTSKIRSLRRSLLSDPHLWIAFAASSIFLLLDILHPWLHFELPPQSLLIVVTIYIVTLVADRLKEGEQVRENTEKLSMIANSFFGKGALLRRRPTTGEEYEYLWGGYTGNYYVYNPSYQVDKNTGEEEIVKILIRRYQHPHFEHARYLFLTKDAAGKADLKTFRRLMGLVKQAYPAVTGKVEVKELKNKESSSGAETYLGTRFGHPIGVMELKEPTLHPQHGTPHYYLVIHDKEAIEHYHLNHFEPIWNDPEAQDVELFRE